MAITSSDLEYYKSNGTNSTGGTITATAITDNTLNNLFDDVTADESDAGATEYRKVFVKNNHGTLTWQSVVFWRSSDTLSTDDEISLGIGSASDDDGSNELTAFGANAVVSLESDGADTRNVTLVGEDAAGARQTETVALTGTTPVLSSGTFSKLYLVYPASSDASRTITIKQGSGGTTRGTIAPNKLSAILYQNPTTKAAGFELGNIAAAGSYGLWLKRVVTAGAAAYTSNSGTIKAEGETT